MTNNQALYLEVFIVFLKHHRAYSSFVEQSRKRGRIRISEPINDALIWANTKEGHSFWSKLSYKWFKLVRDFDIKDKNDLFLSEVHQVFKSSRCKRGHYAYLPSK